MVLGGILVAPLVYDGLAQERYLLAVVGEKLGELGIEIAVVMAREQLLVGVHGLAGIAQKVVHLSQVAQVLLIIWRLLESQPEEVGHLVDVRSVALVQVLEQVVHHLLSQRRHFMATCHVGLPVGLGHAVVVGHEIEQVETVGELVHAERGVDDGPVALPNPVLGLRIELHELEKQAACLLHAFLPGTQLEHVVGTPKHAQVGVWPLMQGIQLQYGTVSLLEPTLLAHLKNVSHFHGFQLCWFYRQR